jgi:hypothetical protein
LFHLDRGVYLTLTIRNTEIEQETGVSNLHPPKWLEQQSKKDTKNRMEFAVFRRYRTSLIITVKRKGLLGIYYTVGMAEYWLTNIKDSCETEVEIPIFETLPKCFPPSDIDDADDSQESDDINIVRCESPEPCDSSQRKDDSQMIDDSITHEKAPEKVTEHEQLTAGSKDVIQPEEVGESSQSDEKIRQKDANNTESVSEDNKNEKQINKSSDQLPLKSTEVSSEKSDLNTSTETLATNKSTTSISASSEGVTNVQQESSAVRENITSDAPNDNSTTNSNSCEIKGFLNFKVYFRPGLSLSHEKDVMRSLTGADASILCQNPLEDVEEQRKRSRGHVRRDTDVYGERSLFNEPEKRINTIHSRRSMRQLQWVKDLLKAKVISMSGKRDWEDQEIIEHEA